MRAPNVTRPLPGKPESCWTATAPETAYPKLTDSETADVIIVGAGIVGLTTVHLLVKAGLSVGKRGVSEDRSRADPPPR